MRISIDEYFINITKLVSLRSTCSRRFVGCVLVDKNNYVISTGFNGVAHGMNHCIDRSCKGADFKSGEGLDDCEAIHAEINAIAHCSNPKEINKAYCTTSPCINCTKALAATTCKSIIFIEEYPHLKAKTYWKNLNRSWIRYNEK